MSDREQQGDGVDAKHREVLADEDFGIRCRQGEQQFVGSQFLLVGPDGHRDGRDDEQQQEGKLLAELVEGRQVVGEELGVEGEKGSRDNKHDNEQVAENAREVARDISLQDCKDDVAAHDPVAVDLWSLRVRRFVRGGAARAGQAAEGPPVSLRK